MAYQVVHAAPQTEDFTALSAHQEQTPGTFFGGRPVLHFQCPNATVRITRPELDTQPDFAALLQTQTTASADELVEARGIDVWVTSRNLALWNTAASHGLEIPYPTIGLHAQDGNAVLLQLILSDQDATEDEDLQSLQLRIVPTTSDSIIVSEPSAEHESGAPGNGDSHPMSPEQRLYDAISACQELNPDPNPDDEDEGTDETIPGATGWITSENMAQFMDAEGNFRIPQDVDDPGEDGINGVADGQSSGHDLGNGAGTRRTAAEVD
ncbi:hypothetical protein BAUCODRAFT_48263, partial [Baudoinia panamericana UAMH 10762]